MRVVHVFFIFLYCFTAGGTPQARASSASSEQVTVTGALPSGGKAVLRSGLQWMDERAPLFLRVQAELCPLLEARGFSLLNIVPSAVQPVPQFPVPSAPGTPEKKRVPPPAPGVAAPTEAAAQAAAAELKAAGRLPQVSLRRYDVAHKDTDLPKTVLSIAPPDPQVILFALSQQRGMPLVKRAGSIPGSLPPELVAQDAQGADVAFVLRLALVQPQPSRGAVLGRGGYAGGSLIGSGSGGHASSGVQGVTTLGAQAPLARAPLLAPGQGTAQDFARGYEGMRPELGRPHVAADMRARDYAERLAPPPPLATPPQSMPLHRGEAVGSLGSSVGAAVSGRDFFEDAGSLTAGAVAGGIPAHTGYRLELFCYDLAPARSGGAPALVWQSVVLKRAKGEDAFDAFAGMARLAVEGTTKK